MSLDNRKVFFTVLAVTVLLYIKLHVLTAEWVYEDDRWYNGFKEIYAKYNWHFLRSIPNNDLTLLTFWHNTPVIAHSINLLIHVINALLLVSLVNLWSGPGWLVGSLFVANPMGSQAVSYAGGRGDLLSLTVLLLSLITLESKNETNKLWVIPCLTISLAIKPFLTIIIIPMIIWRYISSV